MSRRGSPDRPVITNIGIRIASLKTTREVPAGCTIHRSGRDLSSGPWASVAAITAISRATPLSRPKNPAAAPGAGLAAILPARTRHGAAPRGTRSPHAPALAGRGGTCIANGAVRQIDIQTSGKAHGDVRLDPGRRTQAGSTTVDGCSCRASRRGSKPRRLRERGEPVTASANGCSPSHVCTTCRRSWRDARGDVDTVGNGRDGHRRWKIGSAGDGENRLRRAGRERTTQ